VLRTRSPLSPGPKSWFSLDLHVLGAPPAFVLSQDQTLHQDLDRTAGYPRVWSSIGELLRNLTEVEEQLNELTEPPFRHRCKTTRPVRTASLAFGVHCSVFKELVPDISRDDTCSHPGPGPEGRANPHGLRALVSTGPAVPGPRGQLRRAGRLARLPRRPVGVKPPAGCKETRWSGADQAPSVILPAWSMPPAETVVSFHTRFTATRLRQSAPSYAARPAPRALPPAPRRRRRKRPHRRSARRPA
jgi:hypothetical protein